MTAMSVQDNGGTNRSMGTVLELDAPAGIEAVSFDAVGLGDRSYLVHDGEVAVVVDPQRDPGPYALAAQALGVRITHVLETHVHNDYVSGGLGLARLLGATYVLPEGEDLAFAEECTTLGDGAEITTGALKVSALATPGHTPHHLSYLVTGGTGGPGYACTGGSVLVNGVGRTDLLGDEVADELARAQWHSARRLLGGLDARTRILPTHGFGSFCNAKPAAATEPGDLRTLDLTVGFERERNPAVLAALEEFVATLRRDRPPVPAYYRHMAPLNRAGAVPPRYQPVPRLDGAALERRLAAGSLVADLRPRRAFATGHRRGALNIELGDNFTTYFGWVVPFEAPYSLIACSYDEVEKSRRLLARIGRELAAGFVLASDIDLEHADYYPVATFGDLAAALDRREEPLVLDVRHRSEWHSGHLAVARHLPLPELEAERLSLPGDRPVWVHCAAGFRAAIAASRLSAWGMTPVLVDDHFENTRRHNLVVVQDDGRHNNLDGSHHS